ncbi:MAG: toxic anion resistance protein [Candidatus Dormibacteraceae bacterium]
MTADNQNPAPGDASAGALVLTPPDPVAAVTPAQATAAVKLDPATEAKLDATVASFVQSLATLDVHSTDFQKKVDSVSAMGDDDIRQSAQVSNNLLNKPAAAMSSGVFDPTSQVAGSLVKLRRTVEDLDPAKQGILHGTERKILGIIPFGNALRDYFHKYQSGQANINAIIQSLYSGQDALRKDNASIEQEKVNLWAVMQRLQQYDYMTKKMDAAVSAQVEQVATSDPERAKILQQDVLFYVRQKDQDILTQLAVSVQGYLALDVIRRNNLELIKGVDRATTTTVSALRTAVIVAQALANQKLVLDQITALNTTTGNLIESTSELLRTQSAQIGEQAASSTINLDQLQTAFNNIYATIDQIDSYKVQALGTMKQTVDALSVQVEKSQSYLQRAQRPDTGTADLALPPGAGGSSSA